MRATLWQSSIVFWTIILSEMASFLKAAFRSSYISYFSLPFRIIHILCLYKTNQRARSHRHCTSCFVLYYHWNQDDLVFCWHFAYKTIANPLKILVIMQANRILTRVLDVPMNKRFQGFTAAGVHGTPWCSSYRYDRRGSWYPVMVHQTPLRKLVYMFWKA